MKRYLTAIFIVFGILSVVIGFQFNVRWNGMIAWGLALIFFIFAAYFTKYISEDKPKGQSNCEEGHS